MAPSLTLREAAALPAAGRRRAAWRRALISICQRQRVALSGRFVLLWRRHSKFRGKIPFSPSQAPPPPFEDNINRRLLTGGQQHVVRLLGHAGLGASQSDGVGSVLPAPGSRAGVGAPLQALVWNNSGHERELLRKTGSSLRQVLR